MATPAGAVIKYIGRKTDFKGKTLWEIVGNLKGGGVGRIVVRSMFERYPEPSFMRILKVEADTLERPRKVKVLVQKVFRGRQYEAPTLIYSTSYKADYRLLHKDEEEQYCKFDKVTSMKEIPGKMEFPPLMKEMILREYAKKGEKAPEELYLPVKISNKRNSFYVKVDNTNEVLPIGLGKPVSPQLYESVSKE